MSDQSHKNVNPSEPSNSGMQGQSGATDAEAGSAQTRRRFLKAGLIGVPMIVTLRSRPAHALKSLGSAGIFYGVYVPIQTQGGTTRWVPVDQNGEPMIDPTRRTPNPDPNTTAPDDGATGPQLDSWSPSEPQLDNWSPSSGN